jgi:hypothetical protein
MRNYYLIILLGVVTVLSGCSKDFLNKYPTTSINENNFWKDEGELKEYANSLYTFITGHSVSTNLSPIITADEQSDNMVPLTFNVVAAGEYVVPSTGGGWDWTFIRSCNYFLVRYGKTPIADAIKNRYGGEVRFFKAWDYFNKVKKFGDVPWLSKDLTTDSPELFAPRDSRILVMDSVLATIDTAIAQLPSKAEAEPGRINRDMALLLKARICLHEGTFRKYHGITGGDKFLQEAAAASSRLMTEGNYSLYNTGHPETDYGSVFNSLDLSGNKEIILYKDYKTGAQGTATLWNVQLNNFNDGLSKSLVDAYLCLDGKPISQSGSFLGHDSIQAEMKHRDLRLAQTVTYPGTGVQAGFSGPAIPGSTFSNAIGIVPTGYQLTKFWTNDQAEFLRIQNGIMNAPIFRYAEVLLINAEANAELGLCTQTVINNTINLLRARAGVQPMTIAALQKDADSDFPDVPVLIDEIRRERRVELAIEGFRYDDLMRWKAGELLAKPVLGMKFVQSQYPGVVVGKDLYVNADGFILPYAVSLPQGRKFKNYLFPLPLDELQLNTNLVQNPGW